MVTLIEVLIAIGVGILIILAVLEFITDQGEKNVGTVDSFRVAGFALCSELESPQLEICISEVQAEWTRALASQSNFDISNVPSIPASSWP